ncbi:hypothetical protein LINPERPRIM_LOCUS2548, partial [Linum perenne]
SLLRPTMDGSTVLLKTLPRDRTDDVLCLRLLNAWKVFVLQGTIVEWNSHRAHADIITPRVVVGCVYKFKATLRADFANVLDPVSLVVEDNRKPVVIAIAGLMVESFNCMFRMFRKSKGTLRYVAAAFDTPEKRSQHVADSYRTVSELIAQIHNPTDLIKMRASDDTGTTTFLLLGRTVDHVMPISAADLARAFPNQESILPPPIENLRTQTLTFEVRISLNPRPGANGDFNISRGTLSASKQHLVDTSSSFGELSDPHMSPSHFASLSFPSLKTHDVCSSPLHVDGVCGGRFEPVQSLEQKVTLSSPVVKKSGPRTKRRSGQSKISQTLLVDGASGERAEPVVSAERMSSLSSPAAKTTRPRTKRRSSSVDGVSGVEPEPVVSPERMPVLSSSAMLTSASQIKRRSANSKKSSPSPVDGGSEGESEPVPATTSSARAKRRSFKSKRSLSAILSDEKTCGNGGRSSPVARRQSSVVVSSEDDGASLFVASSAGSPCVHDRSSHGGDTVAATLNCLADDDVPLCVFAQCLKSEDASVGSSVRKQLFE